MKLVFAILTMSLLVACSDNAEIKARRPKLATTPEAPRITAPYKNIDGNYVSVEPKGFITEDGTWIVTGDIVNLYTIKGTRLEGYEIDYGRQQYSTFTNQFMIFENKSELPSVVSFTFQQHSCQYSDANLAAGIGHSYVASAKLDGNAIRMQTHEVDPKDSKKEVMMKISEEETRALLNSLNTLERLNNENCVKRDTGLPESEPDIAKIQARLNEVTAAPATSSSGFYKHGSFGHP